MAITELLALAACGGGGTTVTGDATSTAPTLLAKTIRYNNGTVTGYSADPQGHTIQRSIRYYNSSADSTWFNGDDNFTDYVSVSYDIAGHQTDHIVYAGSGSDGIWKNGDDIVSDYGKTTYSAGGYPLRDIAVAGALTPRARP